MLHNFQKPHIPEQHKKDYNHFKDMYNFCGASKDYEININDINQLKKIHDKYQLSIKLYVIADIIIEDKSWIKLKPYL